MTRDRVNSAIRWVLVILSVAALLAVLSGYTEPPQPDEGAAAHIFQLSVVAFVLLTLLFFATADRKQPRRIVRRLTLPATTLMAAFAALYFLEHYR